MSQAVKCEVCGGIYNSRYLASHKRWAHHGHNNPLSQVSEEEAMKQIVALFKGLSPASRAQVLASLNRVSKKSS